MAFSETLKTKIRKRAHMHCCLCKSLGIEVHHIIPQSEGGLETDDNAAPLCPSCHEIYGANPEKRKFIKEARDCWYEICDKRYSPDSEKLDEIKTLLKGAVSYNDFLEFKEEIISRLDQEPFAARSEDEIIKSLDVFFDKVWYNRHQLYKVHVESGKANVDPEIWAGALKAEKELESRYSENELGPWDDFEWGMINGKLSALRWVLGDEWDMLDT